MEGSQGIRIRGKFKCIFLIFAKILCLFYTKINTFNNPFTPSYSSVFAQVRVYTFH